MRLRFLFALITSLMIGIAEEGWSVEPIELSVKAEPKTVNVGDEIAFDITVKHLPQVQVFLPGAEVQLGPFEVKRYRPLPRNEGEGFVTEGGTYRLTIFELGTHVIPSVSIPYVQYGEQGLPPPSLREGSVQEIPRKFAKTQPIQIVVRSLVQEKQETEKTVPTPLKKPAASSGMVRLAKRVMLFLAGVGFLCLTFYGFFYFLPRNPVYRPPAPPHRIAEKALKEIERKQEDLSPKEITLRLSEILREYLAGRFEKLSLHLPTGELLSRAREEKALSRFLPQLSNFFEEVDLVKFADHPASPETGQALLQVVHQLVAKTTPQEKKGA